MKILEEIVSIDLLKEGCKDECFIGRPFYFDYEKALILVADAWKFKVGGIPQGAFLLAFYENGDDAGNEALLLRVLKPTNLPTDNDVTSSMIEYYKDDLKTTDPGSDLDQFTKYEFSFSGIECRVLGTFYRDAAQKKVVFGADLENFYSAHNYKVYKPTDKVLSYIVNGGIETKHHVKIGDVRYSSSERFQDANTKVGVHINPKDFLGKRTALFGMTRTGKSNTVKKIIEATSNISGESKSELAKASTAKPEESLEPFDLEGAPKFPVGQIVFDINGEYANANLQDKGAIFEMFKDKVTRYSTIEKPDFKIMKVNFYKETESGFELVKGCLIDETGDYVKSFMAIALVEPEEKFGSEATRYRRKKAVYECCLFRAGLTPPAGHKIYFESNEKLQSQITSKALSELKPKEGVTPEQACQWFEHIWDNYDKIEYLRDYKNDNGAEWADEDLKALLTFLTRKKAPGASASTSGYRKLNSIKNLHTDSVQGAFEEDVLSSLRKGGIVLIDLSQGDPKIQSIYSERICKKIFADSMSRFVQNAPNNYVQMYFEEAHNLFPKKDDKDLSQIYNRIAKEGAKLHLGLLYATQEVSSISSNILKNTQNWFIAHLNNEDEIKELRKYYDFSDFADSLIKFSHTKDAGFVRMKTYSNSFVVPVQIDRFVVTKK